MFSYWFKSPLLIATEDNDVAKVQILLKDATAETVNCVYSKDQVTPLIAACGAGQTENVLALLAHPDININSKKQSSSALARAAANGHTEIVKTLLARPEVDISEPYALYFAAEKGYIDVVQALLACPDINVNFVGMDELTSLNVAARGNHIEVVKALLARPEIDVKLVDYWGRAPLNNAAILAHSEIVELLLARADVDINAEDHLPEGTPLNGLLVTDYNLPRGPILPAKILSTARLLLGHPAVKLDLIYRDMEEDEPKGNNGDGDMEAGTNTSNKTNKLLHNQFAAAVIGGDTETVENLLLQQKIDVNLPSMMDRTPLHWAAYFGHLQIAQVLLAQPGIALNELDSDERTPLALAAKHGQAGIVKVLLAVPGVTVSAGERDALHSALLQRDGEFDESDTLVSDLVATLQVLLAHPTIDLSVLVDPSYAADIVPNHAQFLAAVLCGDTEKVKIFLARADINVNILSLDHHTALSWASYLGHTAVVQALLMHPHLDLQLNHKSGQLRSAFEWAIRYDHTNIVKALLTALDKPDSDTAGHAMFGDGALLADAVALGRVDIVELLLTRPDVDVAPIKPHEDGRPSPERKKCDELIQKALAERHAQGDAASTENVNKRRLWWDAFGLV